MFADTLDSSWAERSRRGWTTLTSLGLQLLLAGVLLLLPLLRPQGLPLLRRLSAPVSLGQLLAEPPAPAHASSSNSNAQGNSVHTILVAPRQVPVSVPHITDVGPPNIGTTGSDIPGSRTDTPGGMPFSVGGGERPVMPAPPPAITRPIRISKMREGDLIRRVQPQYPPIARTAGIHGQVVLQAVISKEGTIENLHVVTGHPMLVRAATDAVSQWRYRPYILNNEPVEVETQITVNFSLTRN
jgi:periplasmic protein TonB